MEQEPLFHKQRYRGEGVGTMVFLGNYYGSNGKIYDLKTYVLEGTRYILCRYGNNPLKRTIRRFEEVWPRNTLRNDPLNQAFFTARLKAKLGGYE